MKHGAKVTLICQTAKIGVGCLRGNGQTPHSRFLGVPETACACRLAPCTSSTSGHPSTDKL